MMCKTDDKTRNYTLSLPCAEAEKINFVKKS